MDVTDLMRQCNYGERMPCLDLTRSPRLQGLQDPYKQSGG
jgi:hypothetical protein